MDTAHTYGDKSLAETGEAVRNSRLPRSEIFVTSKIPCSSTSDVNPEAHIKHGLSVMGLDYVDLMLMHWTCSSSSNTAKLWKAMETMLEKGTARAVGISNFKSSDINTLMKTATITPAVNQCEFSVGHHDDTTLKRCQELGITYAAYSPLGGLQNPVDVLHDPDVTAVANNHGRSTAEVALRWVVQQGVIAVSSTTKETHMRSDLSIFDEDFELSEQEMSRLHAVTASRRRASSVMV